MLERLEDAATMLQQGDMNGLKIIYECTCKSIFSFVFPIVKNKVVAEDVMQATYIQVYEKINSYTPGTNFRNWILTIAKNLALYELKKAKCETLSDDNAYLEHVGGYTYDESLDTSTIELASQILSDEDFKVVMLFAVGEYKHREIAEMLNLPLGTVTWKYNNAIKKLKEAIKKSEVKVNEQKTN